MKTFSGIDIREVWNYRLSTGVPIIDRRSGTWVVHIFAKNALDYDPTKPETLNTPLESFDTGIVSEANDEGDRKKIIVCYEWLYSVRDKYSVPNIEEMKPYVAAIEKANAALAGLGDA